MKSAIETLEQTLSEIGSYSFFGRVTAVQGMLLEIGGIDRQLSVGGRCIVHSTIGKQVPCEVVGFRNGRALVMPLGTIDGIGLGCRADIASSRPAIFPTEGWLGRVVNAFGEPMDNLGPLPMGREPAFLRNAPPPAHQRQRMGGKMDVGIRAMNAFLTLCNGQRMGIFAGSGVGKSTLLSMLARYATSDVNVIGLIGERGREVQEFLEDDLGPEGLARSVVVIATGDEPPLVRRQAAYMTMAIAESFRDRGRQVLCMMDSVTRFAMAQREIGLSAGEPPTSKGYPPTTFSEMAKLLERAGPGPVGLGSITGLFTVLVEGDDHNEPVADAARGILDGHIVLERSIGERGRWPAINLLRSVSRALPGCNTPQQNELIAKARTMISTFEDMAELIRLGAYRQGTDPKVDEAIRFQPTLDAFLSQGKYEQAGMDLVYSDLAQSIGVPWTNEA